MSIKFGLTNDKLDQFSRHVSPPCEYEFSPNLGFIIDELSKLSRHMHLPCDNQLSFNLGLTRDPCDYEFCDLINPGI